MTCANCGTESAYIKYWPGIGERCHSCGEFSEAGGTKLDGLLTRNSLRVRSQAVKNEADFLPAHKYNKVTRRFDPNPEFIKLYGKETADNLYTPEEVKKVGLPKLADHIVSEKAATKRLKAKHKVQFEGEMQKGMERVLQS